MEPRRYTLEPLLVAMTQYIVLKSFTGPNGTFESGDICSFGPGMAKALLGVQAIREATEQDLAAKAAPAPVLETKPEPPPALETKPARKRAKETK